MEKLLRAVKSLIPKRLFKAAQPAYHYLLAFVGALWYRFPSHKLYVVGVTGTKGKTTTVELVAAILREAGYRVAFANTNQLAINGESEVNMKSQSTLGRTRLQRFLRHAVDAGCTHAVLEMTSEGAVQYRHKFVDLDALIFTNLSPEHIESHGSYEKYVAAKVMLARALEHGDAEKHIVVVNADDAEAEKFLAVRVGKKIKYRISDAQPFSTSSTGSELTWRGRSLHLQLPGEFNIMNALAAAAFSENIGISVETIRDALQKFGVVRGRMERIDAGQNFSVIVDYAHTADSLDRALGVYAGIPKICIMGGTGGGRDHAKRKVMGSVADKHCDYIILTTEDPYDESPEEIARDVAEGIKNHPYEFILDRRSAIQKAFRMAKESSVVFITGKGDNHYLMGPRGALIPWNDAQVAREELAKLTAADAG